MKMLLDIPDDKATTLLNFLKSISYVRVKPLNYTKGQLIDEISEAFVDMKYDESFGKIMDYNVGDIVVWRGDDPVIGRVKGKRLGSRLLNSEPEDFVFVLNELYDSLHPANLRFATDGEIKLLGDTDILVLNSQ